MSFINRFIEQELPEAGASALGTGETDGLDVTPPAGAQNTDTSGGGAPPETIPYSRFKEVNDQLVALKDYKPLADIGYDADSLRRLAEFEVQFKTDPVTTWFAIAAEMENIPPEIKEAAQRHLNSSSNTPVDMTPKPGDGASGDEEMPEWAKRLAQTTEGLTEAERARAQREAESANNQLLDGIMEKWRSADEAAQIKSPDDRKMLTFIIAHARGASSVEDILEGARNEWLELREETLGSAIQPGTSGLAPRPVPSGGAPVNAAGEPKTLTEAAARAKVRLSQE